MRSLRRLAAFRRRAASGDAWNGDAENGNAGDGDTGNNAREYSNAGDGSANGVAEVGAAAARGAATGAGGTLSSVSGVRGLPRPALRWIGPAGRIALRGFDFAADADAVCAWQRETYSLNFADFRFTDSFAAAFRHDLRRAALDPNHGLFVLDEGQIIGFLWLVICENAWTGERYGYVNNLYITPARRSGGLAGELMSQADAWFRERRIKRARLTVTVANRAACRLYERCGYSVARQEMEKDL